VTRLDHAAYLGREFVRAEIALATGQEYVQDYDVLTRHTGSKVAMGIMVAASKRPITQIVALPSVSSAFLNVPSVLTISAI